MTPVQNPNVVQLCPASPDRVARFFKEITVSDTVKIPEQKPDKEQVANISTEITLEDVQTIEVDLPDSEGIDGNKIFVAGNVYLNVQYVSTKEEQTVHFVRFQLPFQTEILTDCGELIPVDDPIFGPDDYVVHVCIEKLEEEQLDERTINFELVLLVWVERIPA